MREIPLHRLAETLGATVDETARAIKITTFTGIIRATRVGNPDGWKSPPPPGYVGGRLRGNWQTSTGRPKDGELERIDPSGTAAAAEVQATVRGDTVDYITNNLPYAEVWEEKDGMIARNVARIDRNIRRAIREQR